VKRAVVVYESMYGNTRAVADAIGQGLGTVDEVVVVPVAEAAPELLASADLVVVGAPTHVHGLPRPTTRKAAAEAAAAGATDLVLEPAARGPGVREWLASLGPVSARAAAFDTRVRGPAALTGRASHPISRGLRRHGLRELGAPESFFVTRDNDLEPGEESRAREWGVRLAASLAR
jgi:hypothetical protein